MAGMAMSTVIQPKCTVPCMSDRPALSVRTTPACLSVYIPTSSTAHSRMASAPNLHPPHPAPLAPFGLPASNPPEDDPPWLMPALAVLPASESAPLPHGPAPPSLDSQSRSPASPPPPLRGPRLPQWQRQWRGSDHSTLRGQLVSIMGQLGPIRGLLGSIRGLLGVDLPRRQRPQEWPPSRETRPATLRRRC